MEKIFYGRKDGKVIFSATDDGMQVFREASIDDASDETIAWVNENFGRHHVNPGFSWTLDTIQTKEQRDMIAKYLVVSEETEETEETEEPVYVKCSCGHICDSRLLMSTTRGTSCPDCYDDMSL